MACRIFIVAHRNLFFFSCCMRILSCGIHAGSSSLTGDWTWAPCIGSKESYPLDHQGSPSLGFFPCLPFEKQLLACCWAFVNTEPWTHGGFDTLLPDISIWGWIISYLPSDKVGGPNKTLFNGKWHIQQWRGPGSSSVCEKVTAISFGGNFIPNFNL